MAAALYAGPIAAASGRSAACLHGLRGFVWPAIEVSTTAKPQCRRETNLFADGESFAIRRVDERLIPEIVGLDGIPATSVRRTLIDLAGRKDHLFLGALDSARQLGIITISELWIYLDQEWMRGRRGVRIMRDALIPRTAGMAPTESELELKMLRVLKEHGFPEPSLQYPMTLPGGKRIRIDFAWPKQRLAIETDGHSYHLATARFESDRARDNELRTIRWSPFRFTWAQLRYGRPYVDRVLNEIRKEFFADCS